MYPVTALSLELADFSRTHALAARATLDFSPAFEGRDQLPTTSAPSRVSDRLNHGAPKPSSVADATPMVRARRVPAFKGRAKFMRSSRGTGRCHRKHEPNSFRLVAEILRHHQPAQAPVHDANADAPELTLQDVGAMSGRVHQPSMSDGQRRR
jgi:hypothetical protein